MQAVVVEKFDFIELADESKSSIVKKTCELKFRPLTLRIHSTEGNAVVSPTNRTLRPHVDSPKLV